MTSGNFRVVQVYVTMATYFTMFLMALTTLTLEIALTRLLSVVTWYHLAFFVISTAMLGMTAAATTIYLKPDSFGPENLHTNIVRACLGYALVTPLTVCLLCLLPLSLTNSLMSYYGLFIASVLCSLPFYFSGICISGILSKCRLPIGKLYASNLMGASLGCLFALLGLEFFDPVSLSFLCASIGGVAGFAFHEGRTSRWLKPISGLVFVILGVLAVANWSTPTAIRPVTAKGVIRSGAELERWNSLSRVVVYKGGESAPQYWGASSRAPNTMIYQYDMTIDGEAASTIRRFHSLEDIDHLRFDVTNVAYYLRPAGGACVIGVGGARDIQSAILFGHKRIVGIDINPIFIDLIRGKFREFAGIAEREGVTLVADEARSYLSTTNEKYSIIQMSLIDTWASTGAGAFSLSENCLYTVEAWRVFLDRLVDDGIFTVSRWHDPNRLGETGRVISLAVAVLLQLGHNDVWRHLALISNKGFISTLLMSKQPFTDQDLCKLKQVCDDLDFLPILLPDLRSTEPILNQMVSVRSESQLRRVTANAPLNYEPPTDENPYFFNMLRLSHAKSGLDSEGVLRGNLMATVTLTGLILSLLVLSIATIIVPLLCREKSRVAQEHGKGNRIKRIWPGACYFSLIGAGFMLVEIALMQRLSVFLGHPIYALGILLFAIILSAGIGSFCSEWLPLDRLPWVFVYPPVTGFVIVGLGFLMTAVVCTMSAAPLWQRIILSVLLVSPVGILLGFFFPAGMRLAKSSASLEIAWYLALNGIFGVLFSALAVFLSIYVGIVTNLYLAAGIYSSISIFLYLMYSRARFAVTIVSGTPRGAHEFPER